MEQRVEDLGDSPQARNLHEVVELLRRIAQGVEVSDEPESIKPLPQWLVTALTASLGLSPEEVGTMTEAEAMERLQAHWSGPSSDT